MSSPRDGVQFRYERKFSIPELDRPQVESIVRRNPARFSQAFPRRWVNNIYLDTWRFGSYEEKLSGFSENRAKVRIRWYGELFGAVENPVLELKIRQGLLNRKEAFPLEPFAMGAGFSLRTVRDLFRRADLPEVLRQQLLKLQLVLVNRYSRSYLLSVNRAFRRNPDPDGGLPGGLLEGSHPVHDSEHSAAPC